MKHKVTTLMTKTALATSLKTLMEQKPLGKISVREIIEDCGVNRNTFYYHFQDVYGLVKWMFEEEAIEFVKQCNLIFNYEDTIEFVLNYLEENKHICNCAVDAIGRSELKRFFQKDFGSIIKGMIEQIAEDIIVSEDYKLFLTEFYTETIAFLLINWIQSKERMDKQKFTAYISYTLKGSIKAALERASEAENKKQ